MKKILFIEDESALQKTFSDLLSAAGFEMISALDGEIGLELAQRKNPDLVLLDLVLPKMHGLEVLKKLKEDPKTKEVPIIILTNLEGMAEVEKALELGATTYLVKSQYDLKEVAEKIKQILNNK
ncbi:MAG: response regulator [Candidatus Pacebacteria bacterium]|nr:response regulator [Candidatus Paceibacterota bacterium]